MGLDVFDLAAVAGAVERHDDGGDAGVAKRREQAGLVGGMKLGGTLVVFRPALEEVARVEGWRRDVDGHGVSPEMKKPGAMAGLLEGVRRSRGDGCRPDRKSTRLNSITNAHLVCRLL